MARVAPRVLVHSDEIARLEQLGEQLPSNERVRVVLADGTQLHGIVEARPSVQAFFDPQGREGMNALVRLECVADNARLPDDGMPAVAIHDVWLDAIRDVMRLPNPSPPEPSQRTTPSDPNAPAVD